MHLSGKRTASAVAVAAPVYSRCGRTVLSCVHPSDRVMQPAGVVLVEVAALAPRHMCVEPHQNRTSASVVCVSHLP